MKFIRIRPRIGFPPSRRASRVLRRRMNNSKLTACSFDFFVCVSVPNLVRCAAETKLNGVTSRIHPSRTVALADLAKKMIEKGHDVISLAIGEPDFPTPDAVAQAGIEAIVEGDTKYTQNVGLKQLRTLICAKLRNENGLVYDEGSVVVSNGAKQAAFQAILAVCGEGDEVVIPAPYWVSYPEMAVMAGAKPVIVDCPISDGFLLKCEALEGALNERSRLLILCSPSNPTGAMYRREQLEEIAEVVKRFPRLLVLSDEIYEYLAYPPVEHVSFGALPEMQERTLMINGFSKGFAMTGWRLGYLAGPSDYAKACATIQSHTTSAPCSISQRAAIAALEMGYKGGEVVQEMVDTYLERRDYVISRLREMDGVEVLEPDGAFYVFPNMEHFLGKGAVVRDFGEIDSTDELCRYLIQHAHVAVIPGEAFGAPGHIRLSYATSMELLEKALDRIESALARIERRGQ